MNPGLRSTLLKAFLPAAIGLAVVIWLFAEDFNLQAWHSIHFDARTLTAIAVAVLFVIGRDFGLTWRFCIITDGQLSWWRALKTEIMCAFTSAITPSAVGGSALAVFYLNRQGIDVGRGIALTLTTLLFDELFFVVFCPILMLVLPYRELFGNDSVALLAGVQWLFWMVYAGIVIYTALLFAGIILRPQWVEMLLHRVFSWRWLRRWHSNMTQLGANMRQTSLWIRARPAKWWIAVFAATVVSWFSRYFVVNALFWGFVPSASGLLVFGRQFVVWVVLMVSPTPGGSGISEWLFTNYYGDLIGSLTTALVIALLWRLLSYYIYLLAGVCLAPSYFRKK